MLEMLKSFISECLCFTLCRADPHSIHGRLQQRQIMVEFWVLGGWLIKTLQTHFINVSKSYLCCGTQRQSSRGALMHKTMFSRKMSLHFIFNKKALNFIETVAPRWSVYTRMLVSRVQYLKRLLFAGLAFARVIVLNIRKPNGVCCPGCSPRL